jgi:hypothetical protein
MGVHVQHYVHSVYAYLAKNTSFNEREKQRKKYRKTREGGRR